MTGTFNLLAIFGGNLGVGAIWSVKWSALQILEISRFFLVMHIPQAGGKLSDFWPTENVWAERKLSLIKKVARSKRWRKGVGHALNRTI